MLDPCALAHEFLGAYRTTATIAVPPSARDSSFDLRAAYATEAEFMRLRIESGRPVAGRKAGYANKAMWRLLKLETLVWAHVYDDTVRYTDELSIAHLRSPKIEPEIVLKLTEDAVEWMAIGFEIIDCPFPDWQFKPVDFVAAYGFHVALVVGDPRALDPTSAEQLATFKLRLLKNGQVIEEGSGKNSLGSPLKCLTEFRLHQSPEDPLHAGDLISTGTLTTARPIAAGETWSVEIEGLPISNLSLRLT